MRGKTLELGVLLMEEKEHASLHTELQLALAEEWLPLIAACPSQVRDHCSSPIEATAKLTRLGLSPFSHLLFQAQPEALYCTELTSSINSESAGLSGETWKRVRKPNSSSPRTRGPRRLYLELLGFQRGDSWIPAFAGMTAEKRVPTRFRRRKPLSISALLRRVSIVLGCTTAMPLSYVVLEKEKAKVSA